ncbi:MAG: hypothetical protein J5744_01770 [Oscillospiraceae bacterium]|nr:hypothetical protein [Oscillospiraceae bacterium]
MEKLRSLRNCYHEKFSRFIRYTGRFNDIFPIAMFLSVLIALSGAILSSLIVNYS